MTNIVILTVKKDGRSLVERDILMPQNICSSCLHRSQIDVQIPLSIDEWDKIRLFGCGL